MSQLSNPPDRSVAAQQSSLPSCVLVVEDNPLLLNLLENGFDSDDLDATFVSDAEEALIALESGKAFRLLLTDFQLPSEMNGMELAQEAKRRFPDIKVIISSGFDLEAEQLDSTFILLPKPYSFVTLQNMVSQLLANG